MAITQLASGPETLLVQAMFPGPTPPITFRHWTQPALLQQWWPEQAEVQPYTGGQYHLSWPRMEWHLRGQYLAFEPPSNLAFTWRWDHDSAIEATREVHLTFEPMADQGTRLLLTQGPYLDSPEDQEVRLEHHLAG
jgi:uncharacterized protein YndB with AHSA1/START domain